MIRKKKIYLVMIILFWSDVLIYFYISFIFFFLFYHLRAANEGSYWGCGVQFLFFYISNKFLVYLRTGFDIIVKDKGRINTE